MADKRKKIREGIVASDRMDKTRVVTVWRVSQHPLYEKRARVAKRYYVHDERNESRKGDRVALIESRPLSRLKRWRLLRILERQGDRKR